MFYKRLNHNNNKTITHNNPCQRRGSNTGPFTPQAGGLPLGHRTEHIDCSLVFKLFQRNGSTHKQTNPMRATLFQQCEFFKHILT